MVKLQNTGADMDAAEQATPEVEAAVEAATAQVVTPESNGNGEDNGNDAGAGSNIKADIRKYMSLVGNIGREHGTGKRALLSLALTIVEGATEQIIKPDSAEAFYKKFRDSSDKKATVADGAVVSEANEGSMKAQVSKLRSFIKFGNEYRDDGSEIMNRAADVHTRLAADKDDRKTLKLTSTYSALVSVAREHMKDDRKGVGMTEEELRAFFVGAETAEKTGADYIESAIKAIKQAQKGREATETKPEARDPIEHAGLDRALDELKKVLLDVDPAAHAELIKAEEKANEKEAKAAAEEAAAEDEAAE